MHIGFRTSGGRGEYEVVGSHTGYTALSLEGWRFDIRWPDGIVRETGLELEPAESGKPRLRSTWSKPFQVGRMLAATLMLPDPRREYGQTGTSPTVAVAKGYVLSRIGFGPETEFSGVSDLVTIDPSFVDLDNQAHKESVGIAQRWSRIVAVYAAAGALPMAPRALVKAHQKFMASGEAVNGDLTKIVRDLCKAVEVSAAGYDAAHDPLPALEQLLGLTAPEGPSLPAPDDLGEDEPLVSARAAHEYRLAKIRGASGRKFSLEVRQAYNHRCAFCGTTLGGVPGIRSGIDAAHILAWSKHDLDVVTNGLALCKLHHWAFDAALLLPVYRQGSYYLEFTELALQFDADARNRMASHKFEIPTEWLPSSPAQHPSVKYLEILYADLAVTFLP